MTVSGGPGGVPCSVGLLALALLTAAPAFAEPSTRDSPFDFNETSGEWYILGTLGKFGRLADCWMYVPLNAGRAFSYVVSITPPHVTKEFRYPASLDDGRVMVTLDFGGRRARLQARIVSGFVKAPLPRNPGAAAHVIDLLVHGRSLIVTTAWGRNSEVLPLDITGAANAYARNQRCTKDLLRKAAGMVRDTSAVRVPP